MIVLAFDPGQTGAYAVLKDHVLVAVGDLPVIDKQINPPLLAADVAMYAPDEIVLEHVHAMPVNGSKANFSMGQSAGIIKGVCANYPLFEVGPRTWKKTHKITGDRNEQKEKARRLAIERWPDMAEHFRRKMDADRAEAALIGLHWVMQK